VRRLHAGDRLALTDDTPQGAPAAAPAVVRTPHTGNAARAEETPLTDGTPRANVSMTPADVGAQRVDLDATRPPARVATPDSPAPDLDAMLARADAARARGDTREAARWLTELEQTHGDDPRGALAAFTLGRIQLEGLHEPRAAAATFARIVARGTPRALLEDAQARRVEALLRAGDLTEARHALAELERRWPSARRLDEARALVRAAEGSPGE
jgi:transmembrane sensor